MANYQFLNDDLIIIDLSESVFTSDKFNDVDQLDIYRLLYYKHTNTNKTIRPTEKKNIEYYIISKENETKKTYTHKSNIYKTKTNTMGKKSKVT